MTITSNTNGAQCIIAVGGRIDTVTAPELEKEVLSVSADVTELVIDFEALDYISSAGLRVLLQAQKMMNKRGTMVVKNVNETISEVFEVTGFSDILTIE